jgi:PAS domain S-box-containing protein
MRLNRPTVSRPWLWGLAFFALCALTITVGAFTYQAAKTTVTSYAADAAAQQAQTMTLVRNFYSEEIVKRAHAAGLELSHDDSQIQHFPLPATFMLEISDYFHKEHHDTQVRLYSDQPFPWRTESRRLDAFQVEALANLRLHPDQAFQRVESLNGQQVLRYAQADRMTASCVACHNSYLGTPKSDWKVGDVRGALEVTMRLQPWQDKADSVLNRSFGILGALLALALLALALTWRRIASALSTSERAAVSQALTNQELTHEIQKRAEVEATLRLSETKLNTIFAAVPEGLVVADTHGTMSQANAALCDMFGYSVQELIGRNISVLMTQSDADQHDQHLERYLRHGKESMLSGPRVVTGQRRDGSTFALRVMVRKTRDDNGVMYIGVMQDYSAIQEQQRTLVEAKNKAEEASRLKTRFLANMSHEIRTPMNGIVGMTELTLASELNDEQREYLTMVQESADHLLHVINDILDFSKIEAGALSVDNVIFSLHQLLRHTLRAFEPSAQAKALALQLHQDASVPNWVVSDPVRLRQILNNLLGNAIKFTQHGQVEVRVHAKPSATAGVMDVHFEVRDTGIGFDSIQAAHLFEAFVQADGSITRSFGGTGLGLAIARSTARLMGGDIVAQSEPGHGARFAFALPLQTQSAPTQTLNAVSEPAPTTRGLHILLVEDHQVNQILAQAMLARLGHTWVLANHGQEALDAMDNTTFDLVLLDVMMPVLDGMSTLAAIRSRDTQGGGHTPVVMMTAHALSGDRENLIKAGADGYIAKPYTLQDLRQEILRLFPA